MTLKLKSNLNVGHLIIFPNFDIAYSTYQMYG